MRREENIMSSFGALVMGAIIGAAAVFLTDQKNRKKINLALEDWQSRVEDKAEDIKQKGLDRVSEEISKAQTEVKKRK